MFSEDYIDYMLYLEIHPKTWLYVACNALTINGFSFNKYSTKIDIIEKVSELVKSPYHLIKPPTVFRLSKNINHFQNHYW